VQRTECCLLPEYRASAGSAGSEEAASGGAGLTGNERGPDGGAMGHAVIGLEHLDHVGRGHLLQPSNLQDHLAGQVLSEEPPQCACTSWQAAAGRRILRRPAMMKESNVVQQIGTADIMSLARSAGLPLTADRAALLQPALDAWLRDATALSQKMSDLRDISPVISFKHDVESEG
jgi:hypothetical protein